jgi:hypothetical protein
VKHLPGGYGDIVKCPNTAREIDKEMNEALNNGKRARTVYLDDDVMEDEAVQDDDVQVMGSRSCQHHPRLPRVLCQVLEQLPKETKQFSN